LNNEAVNSGAGTWRQRTCIEIAITRDTTCLILSGRFVRGHSGGLLHDTLSRVIHLTTRTVNIEMHGVEKIDAYVLGVLAFFYDESRSEGITLSVENPPPFVREMFRVTGLTRLSNCSTSTGTELSDPFGHPEYCDRSRLLGTQTLSENAGDTLHGGAQSFRTANTHL